MKVNFAHMKYRSESGADVSFAVFEARSNSGSDKDNRKLLEDLVRMAQGIGLRVEKAALVFQEGERIKFWGNTDLVQRLANGGVPKWTHYLDIESGPGGKPH
jgi:hypothetical protein